MNMALKRGQRPKYERVVFLDVAEREDERSRRKRKVTAYWQAEMPVADLLKVDADARARWLDDPAKKRKGILLGIPGAFLFLWLAGLVVPTVMNVTSGSVEPMVLVSQAIIGLALTLLLFLPVGFGFSRLFKPTAIWCFWRTLKVEQQVDTDTGEVKEQRLYELAPLRPKALMESWVKDEGDGRAHAITPMMMLKVLSQTAWKNTIGGERRGLGKEAFGALLVLALILGVLMIVINAMNTPAVAPVQPTVPTGFMEVLRG
jgi:hypothetical protein